MKMTAATWTRRKYREGKWVIRVESASLTPTATVKYPGSFFYDRGVLPGNTGGIFDILGRFWSFLSILGDFDHFLGSIFPFFSFFAFSTTVYSHRECHPV
jgi:hypothetical protein